MSSTMKPLLGEAIPLLFLTNASAVLQSQPFMQIKQAMMKVTDLEMPWMQCTRTFFFRRRAFLMNSMTRQNKHSMFSCCESLRKKVRQLMPLLSCQFSQQSPAQFTISEMECCCRAWQFLAIFSPDTYNPSMISLHSLLNFSIFSSCLAVARMSNRISPLSCSSAICSQVTSSQGFRHSFSEGGLLLLACSLSRAITGIGSVGLQLRMASLGRRGFSSCAIRWMLWNSEMSFMKDVLSLQSGSTGPICSLLLRKTPPLVRMQRFLAEATRLWSLQAQESPMSLARCGAFLPRKAQVKQSQPVTWMWWRQVCTDRSSMLYRTELSREKIMVSASATAGKLLSFTSSTTQTSSAESSEWLRLRSIFTGAPSSPSPETFHSDRWLFMSASRLISDSLPLMLSQSSKQVLCLLTVTIEPIFKIPFHNNITKAVAHNLIILSSCCPAFPHTSFLCFKMQASSSILPIVASSRHFPSNAEGISQILPKAKVYSENICPNSAIEELNLLSRNTFSLQTSHRYHRMLEKWPNKFTLAKSLKAIDEYIKFSKSNKLSKMDKLNTLEEDHQARVREMINEMRSLIPSKFFPDSSQNSLKADSTEQSLIMVTEGVRRMANQLEKEQTTDESETISLSSTDSSMNQMREMLEANQFKARKIQVKLLGTIKRLNAQAGQKDRAIQELKKVLSEKEIQVESMYKMNEKKYRQIRQLQEDIYDLEEELERKHEQLQSQQKYTTALALRLQELEKKRDLKAAQVQTEDRKDQQDLKILSQNKQSHYLQSIEQLTFELTEAYDKINILTVKSAQKKQVLSEKKHKPKSKSSYFTSLFK